MLETKFTGSIVAGIAKHVAGRYKSRRRVRAVGFALASLIAITPTAFAARSSGCSAAPFLIGTRVDGNASNGTITAINLPETFSVTGVNVEFPMQSGGRMGAVLGEDPVEVAPPRSTCTSHCQARDQGKGRYPVPGFPSPVPAASRIAPR